MPIEVFDLLPMCLLRVMCMNTEAYQGAVARLAEEGGTHGEQGTHEATEAATRDRGAAICARDAAVRERDAAIRARDEALGERDELMRNAKTKDAEIERLRKRAYGREVFDVDEGVSEVVEGRDEEPAAKRVRFEQVKCSASVVQGLNVFTLSSHCISTSLRPILWTECEETPWVPL